MRAYLKSRMRGHVIVGVMTISTDVDKLYDTDLTDAAWALIAPMLPAARPLSYSSRIGRSWMLSEPIRVPFTSGMIHRKRPTQ